MQRSWTYRKNGNHRFKPILFDNLQQWRQREVAIHSERCEPFLWTVRNRRPSELLPLRLAWKEDQYHNQYQEQLEDSLFVQWNRGSPLESVMVVRRRVYWWWLGCTTHSYDYPSTSKTFETWLRPSDRSMWSLQTWTTPAVHFGNSGGLLAIPL